MPRDAAGSLLTHHAGPDAHRAGLDVVPVHLPQRELVPPADFRSSARPGPVRGRVAEYELFFALGVDGLFSDNPDAAREARDEFVPGFPERAGRGLISRRSYPSGQDLAGWVASLSA